MNSFNNVPFSERDDTYRIEMQNIEKSAQVKGGILRVISERGRDLSIDDPDAFEVISTLALQLERRDRDGVTYDDPDMLTAKAVLQGAVTGLLVAEATYGDGVSTHEFFSAIDIRNEVKASNESARQTVNALLVDIGTVGLEVVDANVDLFDQWSSACVESVSHQYYYRLGFGLVIMSAKNGAHRKAMEVFDETLTTSGYDWDKAFNDMLDGET